MTWSHQYTGDDDINDTITPPWEYLDNAEVTIGSVYLWTSYSNKGSFYFRSNVYFKVRRDSFYNSDQLRRTKGRFS